MVSVPSGEPGTREGEGGQRRGERLIDLEDPGVRERIGSHDVDGNSGIERGAIGNARTGDDDLGNVLPRIFRSLLGVRGHSW